MEEPGRYGKTLRYTGLLIFFLIFLSCIPLNAEEKKPADTGGAASSDFPAVYIWHPVLEGKECTFSLYIADVHPAEVKYSLFDFPDNAYFVSEKKELRAAPDPDIPSGMYTAIDITLLFSAEGSFSPGYISLIIGAATRDIELPFINIPSNTGPLKPEFSWQFSSGSKTIFTAEESSIIELSGVHIAQFEKISFELPEDALFEQLFPATGETLTSENGIVMLKFKWTPLYEGICSLPEITVTVMDYAQNTVIIHIPPIQVTVQKASATSPFNFTGSLDKVSGLFSQAFKNEKTESILPAIEENKAEDTGFFLQTNVKNQAELAGVEAAWNTGKTIEVLVLLRGLEKKSLTPGVYKRVRLAAEKELGLENTPDVPPGGFIIFFIAGAIIIVIPMFLFFRKKYIVKGVISGLLCVFCITGAVYLVFWTQQPWGVYSGGTVKSIPENTASVVAVLNEGTPIRLRKKAGTWCFISFNENTTGWVDESSIKLY